MGGCGCGSRKDVVLEKCKGYVCNAAKKHPPIAMQIRLVVRRKDASMLQREDVECRARDDEVGRGGGEENGGAGGGGGGGGGGG